VIESQSDPVSVAVQRMVEKAHLLRVIMFGSRARGGMRADSDLDLLVILSEVRDGHGEMVRLRRAVGRILIPVDVLAFSADDVREWGGVPGTVLYPSLREGRVLYDAA
jgi:uncharacterized protein